MNAQGHTEYVRWTVILQDDGKQRRLTEYMLDEWHSTQAATQTDSVLVCMISSGPSSGDKSFFDRCNGFGTPLEPSQV